MAGLTKYRPVFFTSPTKNFRLYIQNNVGPIKKKKTEMEKDVKVKAVSKKEEPPAKIEKIIVEETKESFRYKVCEERTPHQIILPRPKMKIEKISDNQSHLQPAGMPRFYNNF